MRKIESVQVSGKTFLIEQEAKTIEGGTLQVSFFVVFEDGSRKELRIQYQTDMVEALNRTHGIDAEDELVSIAEQEIKLELFTIIHNVSLTDVCEGKHPELIGEYVSQFDVNYLNPDVQEKYVDVIAEALK